jgi:hypothetical protein
MPHALPAAPAVTTETLLDEMVDLAKVARFPSPAYTCQQFSSYNRKSKSPSKDWFANFDSAHYLRTETVGGLIGGLIGGRKEYVLMDADGPGAIVRLWSANPHGTLRIYLDGHTTPVLAVPMRKFLGGQLPGFPKPIIGERARGWNSYLPIPYAKRCKVTSDDEKLYYHINYRSYAADTTVATFSGVQSLQSKISEIADRLGDPGHAVEIPEEGIEIPFEATFAPADENATAIPGPGRVVELVMKLSADDLDQALRDFVLRITFDDATTVISPIGDFFGSAPGINPYQSMPMGVDPDGRMWCRWVMPFEKYAAISGKNMGRQTIDVAGQVTYIAHGWTDDDMHFHAKWRIERDIPTRPFRDWNYLTVRGRGVYVGDALFVANPTKTWWGEGDEKIYVDDESFPSHFGTGTEDYYGRAWASTPKFAHAYHNQPRADGPENYGHTANNRWRVMDPIPFSKDFRFDMEIWHWSETVKITYAQISYWYARPGATDSYPGIGAEDLVIPVLPPEGGRQVAGAIEGEEMRVIAKSGTLEPQHLGDRYSSEHHLWWQHAQVGDEIVLGFEIDKAGQYEVIGHFVKAMDYGIHLVSFNGKPIGEPIDFYNPGVAPSGEMALGAADLQAGENCLEIRCMGTNPRADPKFYMFGLDYIRLEPVR